MLIQVLNTEKNFLVFRLNNASRNVFVYRDNSYDDISTNIQYTIIDSSV